MSTLKEKLLIKKQKELENKEQNNEENNNNKPNLSRKWDEVDLNKKIEEKKRMDKKIDFKKKLQKKKFTNNLKSFVPNNNSNNNNSNNNNINNNNINLFMSKANYPNYNQNIYNSQQFSNPNILYNSMNLIPQNNNYIYQMIQKNKFEEENRTKLNNILNEKWSKKEIIPEVPEEPEEPEEEKNTIVPEPQIEPEPVPKEITFTIKDYEDLIKEFKEIRELSENFKFINFEIKSEPKVQKKKKNNEPNNNSRVNFNRYETSNRNISKKETQKEQQPLISRQIDKEKLKKINSIKESSNTYIQKNKEISEYEKTLLLIRVQLNKITPENYDSVLENLRKYINQNEFSDKLIRNLIEKAWNEHIYASSYANLLLDIIEKESKETIKKVKIFITTLTNEKFSLGYKNFKFELDKKNEEKVSDIVKSEFISVYKNRLLGNINFICELFILKFFNPKIIKCMISEFIDNIIIEFNKFLDDKENLIVFETYFQGLIRIFEYCGKEISFKLNKGQYTKIDRNETNKYLENLKIRLNNKDINHHEDIYFKEKDIKINYEKLVFDFFEYVINLKKFPLKIELLIENIIQFKESNYEENIISFKKPKKLNEINDEQVNNNNYNNNNNNNNQYEKKEVNYVEDDLLNEYNNRLWNIFEEDNLKNNNRWLENFKKIYYEKKYEDLNYEERIYEFFFLNSTPRKQDFYDLMNEFLFELFEKENLIDKELFYLINCFYVKNYDLISELTLFQKFLIDLIYNLYEKGFINDENFNIDFVGFYKENYNENDEDKEDDLKFLKKDLIKKFNKYFSDKNIDSNLKNLLTN